MHLYVGCTYMIATDQATGVLLCSAGDLYMLSDHRLISFDGGVNNPKLCGMVPVGVRFAHGFNLQGTSLGLPCPEDITSGWNESQ